MKSLCLVLLLPLLASARLQSQPAPSPGEIEALMRQFGLQRQIAVLPPQLEGAVLRSAASFRLSKSMATALPPTGFKREPVISSKRDLDMRMSTRWRNGIRRIWARESRSSS
jgi:hypothetical protein